MPVHAPNQVPIELVEQVRLAGRLPVVTFAAGGLATPADVGLLMDLGVDGVFVGSGIFKGENPAARGTLHRRRAAAPPIQHHLPEPTCCTPLLCVASPSRLTALPPLFARGAARAMVAACTHYRDPKTVARVSEGLGKAMVGLLEHETGPEVAARLALKGRVGVDPAVGA